MYVNRWESISCSTFDNNSGQLYGAKLGLPEIRIGIKERKLKFNHFAVLFGVIALSGCVSQPGSIKSKSPAVAYTQVISGYSCNQLNRAKYDTEGRMAGIGHSLRGAKNMQVLWTVSIFGAPIAPIYKVTSYGDEDAYAKSLGQYEAIRSEMITKDCPFHKDNFEFSNKYQG